MRSTEWEISQSILNKLVRTKKYGETYDGREFKPNINHTAHLLHYKVRFMKSFEGLNDLTITDLVTAIRISYKHIDIDWCFIGSDFAYIDRANNNQLVNMNLKDVRLFTLQKIETMLAL